jgi:transposase
MNKFSGIDLHSNNSVVVVSDDADRVVYQRRLPNDPVQIRAALAPHREDLVGVVIEATYNWYWLVDQLMTDGYRVHLANPAAIRPYEGLKYSGDFTDAAHLAQLLRLGLLPEGYIYPAEERPVRDLSRKRIQLVQCRTAQILAIENLFSRHTGGQIQGERVKRLDEMQVNGFGFASDVTLAMQANLAVMQTLQEEIGIIEKRLMERVKLRPDYALLNTVPGIGPVLATTIMLETGTISRFTKVGNFSSYCRCVDSRREATAGRKAKAMRRTATNIWRGRLSRRPTSRYARARKPGAFTSARNARETGLWRSRRWRTNWRAPAITCFGSTSHLR